MAEASVRRAVEAVQAGGRLESAATCYAGRLRPQLLVAGGRGQRPGSAELARLCDRELGTGNELTSTFAQRRRSTHAALADH